MKNLNTPRFSFLNSIGSKLDDMLKKVNKMTKGIIYSKPYTVDWNHVLIEYNKVGVGDIEEFCVSYTFGYHAMNRIMDNEVSKEAMFIEMKEYLDRLKKDGDIN